MDRAADDLVEVDERAVDAHCASQAGVVKLCVARRGPWRADQACDHLPVGGDHFQLEFRELRGRAQLPNCDSYSEYRSSIRLTTFLWRQPPT
jgi:hypothetical protein